MVAGIYVSAGSLVLTGTCPPPVPVASAGIALAMSIRTGLSDISAAGMSNSSGNFGLVPQLAFRRSA